MEKSEGLKLNVVRVIEEIPTDHQIVVCFLLV